MDFMCASSLICTIVERTCLSQCLSPFRREAIGCRAHCASRRNLPDEANSVTMATARAIQISSNKTDKYFRNIQLRIFCSTPEIIVVAHTVNVGSTEEFQPIQRNNLRTSCNPNHAE